MDFEQTVGELRQLVGERVAVSITDPAFGPADGYFADFSGLVERIDDPIEGVDAPVHYVRVQGGGFSLHAAMFQGAEWTVVGGERELRITLNGAELSISRL